MKHAIFIALLATLAATSGAQPADRDWGVSDHETIRRSFDLPSGAGPFRLSVDNFSGYIHVAGYDGRQVRMTAERRTGARTQADLERAKREVRLDASSEAGGVRLYVDGPFRGDRGRDGDRNYRVTFDFDLEVPRNMELSLKGFNHGDIVVRQVDGDFEIHGFNGGVRMENIGGAGTVQTFNGKVAVAFNRTPPRPSTIQTFNGSVDAYFPPELNADLHFKTFHGEVYSDGALGALTVPAGGNGGGKFVYRSGRLSVLRAGSGGPVLTFHTFNGSIRLHAGTM